jgi:hypothetical protein
MITHNMIKNGYIGRFINYWVIVITTKKIFNVP